MKYALLAVAALAALACASLTQEPEMFPGTNLPVTIAATELGADYKPLKLKEQSSGIFGDYYGGAYFQFGSLGLRSDGSASRIQELLEILPVAWTKNELVKVYGQEFIVTYILEPSLDDLRQFSEGKPLKNTRLKLKLMKADQIGSIEPFPELNREKYVTLLAQMSNPGEAAVSSATRTRALSNIKQVALSVLMYAGDYDDVLPYVQGSQKLMQVTMPYSKNAEVWQTTNPGGNGTFRFNMSLAGVSMADIQKPAETPMLFDPLGWPGNMHLVGFADGHCKYVTAAEWNGMQKFFKLKLKRHGKPLR